ncbi:hypothetical protein B0H13DRAFT_1890655 [Mycena leptocephala]|nr:hypothetical protein B0H13DRAFT_1890655 [Mycena leptocephala]
MSLLTRNQPKFSNRFQARFPTVWRTPPLPEFLQQSWWNMAATEKFADMRDSINCGLENLEKCCRKTDDSDVYFIGLALDPNYRTEYAEQQWTPEAFINGTEKFEAKSRAIQHATGSDAGKGFIEPGSLRFEVVNGTVRRECSIESLRKATLSNPIESHPENGVALRKLSNMATLACVPLSKIDEPRTTLKWTLGKSSEHTLCATRNHVRNLYPFFLLPS